MELINWFPGHMHKTRKLMAECLPNIEMVIELLDARVPLASRNPMVFEILKEKPKLVLLNKADLADEKITRQWISYYEKQQNTRVRTINSSKQKPLPSIVTDCTSLVKEHKPNHTGPVRALIVGIPNVGKSSFINAVKKQKKAGVQNKPGHTKEFQRIAINRDLQIIDTPGILWTKFEDQNAAVRLAICGSIKDSILDLLNISERAAVYLAEYYPQNLKERFKMDEIPTGEYKILEMIGRKRGFLMKGGIVDMDRASKLLLTEIRDGKLGRITWEDPSFYELTEEEK